MRFLILLSSSSFKSYLCVSYPFFTLFIYSFKIFSNSWFWFYCSSDFNKHSSKPLFDIFGAWFIRESELKLLHPSTSLILFDWWLSLYFLSGLFFDFSILPSVFSFLFEVFRLSCLKFLLLLIIFYIAAY